MRTKVILQSLALIAVGAVMLVSCNKRNNNHAPVCGYGYALVYDDAGYQCRFITLGQYGYGNPAPQPGQNVPGGVLQPPISACPSGQVLVNWRGAWLCYLNETIYPAGGDSPGGPTPPPGRGGEFCTSVGYNGGYYGNYGANSNYYVGCSPGFQCQQGTNQPVPTQSPYNGGYNGGYNNGYNGNGGTCVYRGYVGY